MSRPAKKAPRAREAKTERRHAPRAGRTVYIGLRVYDPGIRIARNCAGLNIRAFDFTAEEVHDIIKRALSDAAREFQAREHVRKLEEGKSNGNSENKVSDVSPRRDVQD